MKKARGAAIRDSKIHRTSKVESGSSVVGSIFERHSFCGYDCTIVNATVGPFTSIGARVMVGGSTHPMHFVSTSPVFLKHRDSISTKLARHEFSFKKTTYIGPDVWVGDGAYIKSGVTIGVGSVIGMGSVVTRDVMPYSIVAGNPARLIRLRFDGDLRSDLIESRWWELDDDMLKSFGHLFNDPVEFIAAIKERLAK